MSKPNFVDIISIDGWDIATSVFEKKRPPYWKSTFGFDFDHLPEICTLFCIRLPNFVQIEAPTAEIWRHIHFSYLLMSLPSEGHKFCRDISNGGWDITTSGFKIQTSAILEFYFRFRSQPVRRNLHDILNQATEFRPNRSTHCGNKTSYPFLKMAATTAK